MELRDGGASGHAGGAGQGGRFFGGGASGAGEASLSVEVRSADGIAEVVIDFPPVNALPVRGWHDLAEAIAAVHGFCLGGGVGLAGNADIVIAAEDATFGLPEVDRGALGAATHLARLVPQPLMRAMVYTLSLIHI